MGEKRGSALPERMGVVRLDKGNGSQGSRRHSRPRYWRQLSPRLDCLLWSLLMPLSACMLLLVSLCCRLSGLAGCGVVVLRCTLLRLALLVAAPLLAVRLLFFLFSFTSLVAPSAASR